MAGKIVHFEVPAGDADRASAFYSGLFGYEIGASTMEGFDYRMFQSAEDQGGAIMPSETAGSGLIVYLDTDDIDASVAKVRELGGNSFSLWQNVPNAARPRSRSP